MILRLSKLYKYIYNLKYLLNLNVMNIGVKALCLMGYHFVLSFGAYAAV